MEYLLNLAGLLISFAIIAGWLWPRKRIASDNRVPMVWQSLAVGLIVLFFFFAISVSDDLHWTVVATEAKDSRKLFASPSTNATATSTAVRFSQP
jgi:hypothetical protein